MFLVFARVFAHAFRCSRFCLVFQGFCISREKRRGEERRRAQRRGDGRGEDGLSASPLSSPVLCAPLLSSPLLSCPLLSSPLLSLLLLPHLSSCVCWLALMVRISLLLAYSNIDVFCALFASTDGLHVLIDFLIQY